ncbi:MAG: hypothetical protein QM606_10580 [Leucobacter sp.]
MRLLLTPLILAAQSQKSKGIRRIHYQIQSISALEAGELGEVESICRVGRRGGAMLGKLIELDDPAAESVGIREKHNCFVKKSRQVGQPVASVLGSVQ